MINSGRNKRCSAAVQYNRYGISRTARFTAILGAFVFTIFLCLSVNDDTKTQMTDSSFGEGAYQVFAPVGGSAVADRDTAAMEDGSVWAYLESVISRLIYGEQ